MNVCCVILNYNDWRTTRDLAKRIHDYRTIGHIVLVDNASTDDSCERLSELRDDKVTVLCSEKNGGYGAGNNLGVRYSIEKLGAEQVLIANPDVTFSEPCVRQMARILEERPGVGVISAVMEDAVYGGRMNGWRLHGFAGELLNMGPVSRRLLGRFLTYPKSYFRGRKAVYVDAVHGSMLMVSGKAFCDCGGYDEGIFLYQEEAVLGQRMRGSGYRTVLLLSQRYRHEHSVSIGKTYDTLIARQKLRNQSTLYYMKHYLSIHAWQAVLARLWFGGILLEDYGAALFGKLYEKGRENEL